MDSLADVDLRARADLLDQYVDLRNRYADLLLTEPVTVEGTEEWLRRDNVAVRALVRGDRLEGAAVLYLHRGGEIAFFAREKGKGCGSLLLEAVEREAGKRGRPVVWGWVRRDNLAARRAFERRGFSLAGESSRWYRDTVLPGVEFRKSLGPPENGGGRSARERENGMAGGRE